MDFDITSVLLSFNDILISSTTSTPPSPPRISEIFLYGVAQKLLEEWKYFAFLFVASIIVLYLKSWGKKC